jgi:hypothetical protein
VPVQTGSALSRDVIRTKYVISSYYVLFFAVHSTFAMPGIRNGRSCDNQSIVYVLTIIYINYKRCRYYSMLVMNVDHKKL